MVSLDQKIVNCYKQYLTMLSYGKTNQDYSVLYGAILLSMNNITDAKYVEYFWNNLICSTNSIVLPEIVTAVDMIAWTLNTSDVLLDNFVFVSSEIPTLGTCSITTNSTVGYHFLYISVPNDKIIKIYDEMSDLVFSSSSVSDGYEFEYAGEQLMSNNKYNSVYKKKNVFNSYNSVTYYIKIS